MADKPEPAGIYQVWHKTDDGYVHAINVDSGNLLGALIMPLVREGQFGGERVTYLIDDARSSTFGDVIVNPEGAAYEIHDYKGMGPGFKEIEFLQHIEIPAIEPQGRIRPLTEQLIDAAIFDVWPSVATIVDFGIDSERHLGALQFAIRNDLVTPQELDAAMGSGEKLTEIAQRGDNPYHDVTFRTSCDKMSLEPPDEPAWYDTKALFAEIRADEYAARVRDYGEADAATYEQRVRDGAGTVTHLEPLPKPLTDAELEQAVSEIERSWQSDRSQAEERPPLFSTKVPDQSSESVTVLFGRVLHGPSTLEPQPQRPSQEKNRDDGGREI